MSFTRMRIGLGVSVLFAASVLAAGFTFTPVPSTNPKIVGVSSPNVLPPELAETPVAQGSFPVENPVTTGSPAIGFYGYDTAGPAFTDGPMLPAPGVLPNGTTNEAGKTEPDKNTYLILRNQHGPDPRYDYGTHFLFQGHEVGRGYITRINLDADGPHRVTVLASQDATHSVPDIDGSTWYPFSHKLLFTSESAGNASILEATPDYPSTVEDLTPSIGHAAYEGVQSDDFGRLVLVEDAGGHVGAVSSHAKQPNSFVYKFVPYLSSDLKQGGILYVLQVQSLAHAGPIKFTAAPGASPTDAQKAAAADIDITSQDVKDLHTYGKTFTTTWLPIHDTAIDGFGIWNANDLAKMRGGTPFKRPENGQFRPGTNFSEFVFDETGDTDIRTEAGTTYGGFGAIFRLVVDRNGSGKLSLVYNGDAVHAGFDNCAFWDQHRVVFVEDAGDTLHTQRNALDSAWLFDLNVDYSQPGSQPRLLLAEGRDPSATLDSAFGALPKPPSVFQNEGDNEITGWHLSDGDPSVYGLLGAKIPTPFKNGWRLFYTQQHGDNFTWEILPTGRDQDEDRDGDRDDRGRDRDRY